MEKKDRIYLPILFDITEKRILFIGAGSGCAQKLRSLSQLGITITVISSQFRPEFTDKDWIKTIQRPYKPGDMEGFDLVYSGVNNSNVESEISKEARERGIPVNFVDHVERSDFISPSALVRKYFSIFISTYGRGPGMTKRIRKLIEERLDLDALDLEAREYIHNRETRKQSNL